MRPHSVYYKTLTPEQVEQAKIMRNTPTCRSTVTATRKIAKALNVSEYALCRALGIEKNKRLADYRNDPIGSEFELGAYKLKVPQKVWEDRERRFSLSHASVTAALMGDPLPHYSALDRRDGLE